MVFDRKLKKSFSRISDIYQSGRKGYLAKLFLDIINISKIKKTGVILDVGCGTGLSTMYFAKKGYKIIGLDISKELLSKAKFSTKNFPKTKYLIGSFEKRKLKKNYFDLVISGQAFHWIDSKIVYKKSFSILKKGGSLAIFAKFHDYDKSKVMQKIRKLYIKYCKNYPLGIGVKNYEAKFSKGIKESELFTILKIKKYKSNLIYDKKDYKDLILSMSWVNSLDKKIKKIFTKNQFYKLACMKKDMKCEKCGYKSKKIREKSKRFLCHICYSFSPDDENSLNEYINEKIDGSLLGTFRKYAIPAGEKQKQGMVKKAIQGNLMSRVPFGYKIHKGKIIPTENFREIEEIFEEFLNENLSLRKIAQKHNLSVNGLKKILRNFTYIGKIKFNNQIYEGKHQPIISTTLFNHVQNKLEKLGIK